MLMKLCEHLDLRTTNDLIKQYSKVQELEAEKLDNKG